MINLKGKNILLTQNQLVALAGSETIILELAEYFSNAKANVFIVTAAFDEPIKSYFDRLNNVTVYTLPGADAQNVANNNKIDIAWIHHNIIPKSLLENHTKTRIIFSHMSPFHPLEYPLLSTSEIKLASKILTNSQETLNSFLVQGVFDNLKKNQVAVFGNPAPDKFIERKESKKTLKKIAVVSNHIPEELEKACKLLASDGYEIDMIGSGKTKLQRVTPELINGYDLIITIGKTVQYCIVSNTPVYCYDHFGGPGYLSEENFAKARDLNFSGRGFEHKLAHDISVDIVKKYDESMVFQQTIDKTLFSLEKRLEDIFNELYDVEKIQDNLTKHDIQLITKINEFIVQSVNHQVSADIKIGTMNKLINEKNQAIHRRDQSIELAKKEINHMKSSRLYKFNENLKRFRGKI